MRTVLVWLAVLMAVAGATSCGVRATASQVTPSASGTATAAATGSPVAGPGTFRSPPPTLVGPRQLTVGDDGATVRLRRGQSVTVALAARGMFSWHVPIATGTAVRRTNGSGGYPTSQPAQATFLATEPGTTTLTAADDTACLHVRPACLPSQQQWQVTVLVR